jgi:chromosome segregation ATPase
MIRVIDELKKSLEEAISRRENMVKDIESKKDTVKTAEMRLEQFQEYIDELSGAIGFLEQK